MRISELTLRRVIRQVITETYKDVDSTLQSPATKLAIEKFLDTPSAKETPVSINGRGVNILPRTAGTGRPGDVAIVSDRRGQNDISGKIVLNDDGKYYIVRSDASMLIWSFVPGAETGELNQD